jgi:hypothetical protein
MPPQDYGYVESLNSHIEDNDDLFYTLEQYIPRRYPYDYPVTWHLINEEFNPTEFIHELVYGPRPIGSQRKDGFVVENIKDGCYLYFLDFPYSSKRVGFVQFYEEEY